MNLLKYILAIVKQKSISIKIILKPPLSFDRDFTLCFYSIAREVMDFSKSSMASVSFWTIFMFLLDAYDDVSDKVVDQATYISVLSICMQKTLLTFLTYWKDICV